MPFRTFAFLLFALLASLLATTAVRLERLSDLAVFGDSYTDNCNTWRFLYATHPQARRYQFPRCPDAPIGRAGGLHTWLEYAQHDLHPSTKVHNFAQGAATCDNDAFDLRPFNDVGQQIELLRTHYNTSEPAMTLGGDSMTSWAALFIGTNDIGFFNGLSDVAKEAQCVRSRLESLLHFGYRNIILFETINLEHTPLHSSRRAEGNSTIRDYVQSNRRAQARVVDILNREWQSRNAVVHVFPTYSIFSRFVQEPSRYGFTDVVKECIGAFRLGYPETCADPEHFLWFDALHPSFRAHRYLANEFLSFLKTIAG